MKKAKSLVPVLLVLILVSGCSLFQQQSLQESWNKLTPDEQARVIIGGLQRTLSVKFDEAKAVVDVNPQYKELWKKSILPAFDKANISLKGIAELAQIGKVNPGEVYIKFKPDFDALILYLLQIGVRVSDVPEFAPLLLTA